MTGAIIWYALLGPATLAVALGTALSRSRSGAAGGRVHGVLEAAFLAGGPGRVADTVICRMHADGRVAVGEPGVLAVLRPVAGEPAEQALLDLHARFPTGALAPLRAALMRSAAVQQIGDRLAARGMLVPPAVGRRWNRAAKGLLGLAGLCAAATLLDGRLPGDVWPGDSGLPAFLAVLPGLVVATVVAAQCARVSRRRITRAGRLALAAYTRTTSFATPGPDEPPWRHRPDPVAGPVATGAGVVVALGGVTALDDPVLRDQLLGVHLPRAGRELPGTSPLTDPGLLSVEDGDGSGGDDLPEPSWCGSPETGTYDDSGGASGPAESGGSCGAASSCGGDSGGSGGGSSCGSSCGGGCGGGGD
ncbi:TIGR04222 domain-containing membrane protein [Streptomyces pactum]|uniref:TIGR04222 domain-containing membrane protein n=1 Tax=Streptomyces pactum TaxID=68249 RepID=A0ABS0NQK6_9ACTN|nr:TIGR04222 domain-containing membrane protein [Streptomyces pactum]MBH5337500.1 TIGR04222 domain-containing membrane protein [Streptomyces pactum]